MYTGFSIDKFKVNILDMKYCLRQCGRPSPADGQSSGLKMIRFLLFSVFLLFSATLLAQQKTITGRVSSNDTALAGVSVQVKGGTAGTQTDAQGRFTIMAPANSTLSFTSIGYAPQEVKLGNSSTLNVNMQSSGQQLADVVVVGYATQKKVTVTGAVAAVKGSELAKSPTVNLSNSLAGRLPGITAIQSSGEPGFDGSTIRIRGTNTLGNSGPLVVIDGVPDRAGGLDRINPADVENVSVLKDASAAIYGSRAANGVILITTKQGRSGKPVVSYDFNHGWQQPTILPKMSNSAEYAELLNEQILFRIPYDQWSAAWTALKSTGSYIRSDNGQKVNAYYSPDDIQKFKGGSNPLTHPNTDWYKAVFKNWSPQERHNLQISGGNEAVRFLSSVGYQKEDAYYRNSATGYKQYDLRLNLDARVNKYISTTVGLNAREEYRFFPTESAGSIFRMLVRGKPTEIAIWPNGLPGPDIENGQNPVVITTNATGYDRGWRDYFQTNGQVELRNPWVEGLKLTLQGAADKFVGRTKRFQTPWYLYYWNKVSFEADGQTPKLTKSIRSTFSDPRLTESYENDLRINLTALLNFDRTFQNVHTINLLAGVTKETRKGDNFSAFRRYFISTAVDQLLAGGTAEQSTGNITNPANSTFGSQSRLSYFGRAAYNYKEKYLAEFVWRYDGSYIFPEAKRFGFFPGVLVGWNISKEDFINKINFFNNLKLRASYGQMGNDRLNLADYAYLSTYSLSGTQVINGQVLPTLTEARVPNLNFTWEVANNADIGLEGTVFRNKISFEFDVFYNKRKNILIQRSGSTPQSTGMTALLPPVNAGIVENKGYEFRVAYNGRVNDLTYTVGLNGGYSRNKVLFWDEPPGAPDYQLATGHSYSTNGFDYLAYVYDGVFRDAKDITDNKLDYSALTRSLRPGDMKFKDINGDGKIDGLDAVRLDKNRDPRFTGGLSLNLSYKNFDLSALFQGATGGLQLINFNETGEFGNWLQWAYDNRWSVDNPSSVNPRLVSRGDTYYTGGGYGVNTYWLRNNNYLRFKNFELGYTLGSKIGQRIGISRLRLYVSGLNLVTWDKMHIWDPEATAVNGYYYPQQRIISTGARVTF